MHTTPAILIKKKRERIRNFFRLLPSYSKYCLLSYQKLILKISSYLTRS
ncbi:hypothetical protein HMPREF6123_1501 [Oribacterium sinus F0268]|uniref:Uncharacterized protein n=1 Tax=Oribacterium sinus F0268 TaxID=585501 RepID=C2KYD2_9FIRM|nr:hypothetical protein HMPREF6123_1501 [Oribacterium sinus F0268]